MCRRVLFQRHDRSIWRTFREALEDIDEDCVGFGDVEADIGDLICDESVKDGKDSLGEDLEGEGGCEGLRIALVSTAD